MAIEVFNRYEHKYMLTLRQYEKLIPCINQHMKADKHNKNNSFYTISNIYFDTDDNYLIRTSLSKPKYKEKLRLRSYGVFSDNSDVYLEIKKKFIGIVNKRRISLAFCDARDFLKTNRLNQITACSNPQIMSEISYFLSIYKTNPKVYIAYDRLAYFEKENPDLRISFDFNIRSRRNDLGFEYGDYGDLVLDKNICIMEIKTAFSKPLWLCDLLSQNNLKRQGFSKYGTEYRQFINKNALSQGGYTHG